MITIHYHPIFGGEMIYTGIEPDRIYEDKRKPSRKTGIAAGKREAKKRRNRGK